MAETFGDFKPDEEQIPEGFLGHDEPEHEEAFEEEPRRIGFPDFDDPEQVPNSQPLFDEFDPQVRQDVEGLIWLGHLEDSFEAFGHQYVIRTLKADEELYAGLIAKEFNDSLMEGRAVAWAQVSLALMAVDGDVNFCPPVGPDREAFARARFVWVTSRWYWPLGEYLFRRYAALLQRQVKAFEALQNLSTRSLPTF